MAVRIFKGIEDVDPGRENSSVCADRTNVNPLTVRGLEVHYRSAPVAAVSGIDLMVAAGEFVSIVGPSGGGKTSILKAIAGLVPVNAGEITVYGDVGTTPVAMVFQSPSLFPWRTVLRNVRYGLEAQHRRADADSAARKALDLVGLSGLEDRYPSQLSGGMQQRVNLARALAVRPSILLLDEPFSSLDAQLRERMQEELVKIWRDAHTTAIFVTHQVDEAVFLSDRVVVVGGGPPAGIVREVMIDLPRPRTLPLKRSPQFQAYEDSIWEALR